MTDDEEMIAAAAIHDAVDDTDCMINAMKNELGDRIDGIGIRG